MKNLVVVEEFARFRPVRLLASSHAIPIRFTETTTFPCVVVRSFPGTSLVHWPPIKMTPRQFGIDWTVKHPTTKSHQATNVNLPASLTTLIDWVFISAYSKYLVVELKVEIICKWSRFEAEWFMGRCFDGHITSSFNPSWNYAAIVNCVDSSTETKPSQCD